MATKEQYEYDDVGNKIKESFSGPDGKLLGSAEYRYDENGNLLEIKGFEEDGTLSFVNAYEYDSQNRVTLEIRRAPYENIQYKNFYTYNDRGEVIEELMYDERGRLSFFSHYEFSYDDKGNWIQKIEFKDYRPTLLIERKITYYDE